MTVIKEFELDTSFGIFTISGSNVPDDGWIDWNKTIIENDNYLPATLHSINVICNNTRMIETMTKIIISDNVYEVPKEYKCYFINTFKTESDDIMFGDPEAEETLNISNFKTNKFLVKIFSQKNFRDSSNIFIVLEPVKTN